MKKGIYSYLRIGVIVISLFACGLLAGCAFSLAPVQGFLYTGVTTPVTYRSGAENRSYKVLGTVESKATATSVLGIVATGDASVNSVYHSALAQQPGAEGLVDVCIDQSHNRFLGLFASYTTTLRAKAVKWEFAIVAVPMSEPIAVGQEPAPASPPSVTRKEENQPTAVVETTARNPFAAWREEVLLQFKDYRTWTRWEKHLRAIKQNLDYRQWVSKLTEQDFQEYQDSTLATLEWLLQKWQSN